MATYVGPLLLVLLGVGGLVFLLGRRMRDVRAEFSAAGDGGSGAAEGFTAWLRSGALAQWPRAAVARARRFLQLVGRAVVRALHRPPVVLRVPRLAIPPSLRGRRRGGVRAVPAAPRPAEQHGPRERPESLQAAVTVRAAEGPQPSRVAVAPPPLRAGPVVASDSPPPAPAVAAGSLQVPALGQPVDAQVLPESALGSGVPRGAPALPPTGREAISLGEAEPRRMRPGRPTLEARVLESGMGTQKIVGRVRRQPATPGAALRTGPPAGQASLRSRERTAHEGARPPTSDLADVPKLIAAGQFARAESLLVEALAANPRHLAAYRLLGLLYLERGDLVQAREVLEEALRRGPQEAALYGPLGRTYFSLGLYGRALEVYQRAHDTDEQNLEYLERLLTIAARMDRRPLVKVTAEKILAIDPNHGEAKKQLARGEVSPERR